MSVVKEGYMQRHSRAKGRHGWHRMFVRLYSDGNLVIFNNPRDEHPKAFINMRSVCKHFARGEHILRNFQHTPSLPADSNISLLLAIPEQPSHKARPHFLLTSNDQSMQEWMSAICGLLPSREVASPVQTNYGSYNSQLAIWQNSDRRTNNTRGGPYPEQPYPQNPYPDSGYPEEVTHTQKKGNVDTNAKYSSPEADDGFGKFGQGRCASWSSIDSIGSIDNFGSAVDMSSSR